MDEILPPLIQALLEPQRYPHAVQRVELVQTHISWVLIAGEFAYKIKKPVKLPFLDFSTLALRHRFCVDELRLNRRVAADIYLEVVAIFNSPQNPYWSAQGEVVEYAVKMRRFDEKQRLDRVCVRGELLPRHLSYLAQSLVAFHQAAAIAPQTSLFGSSGEVMAPVRENFSALQQMLPDADLQARLGALHDWTESQFVHLAVLMDARKRAGWVRECHGDLHLANMVLMGESVRMFDCIEFNEDLRWIDVVSDVAFTYCDLLAHAQPGLANWFVNEVLSYSGDYESAKLLRFYTVYRALVRAKVATIRMRQTHHEDVAAMAHLELAERLVAPHCLRLVITHGLSGCGKTVASNTLLQSDGHTGILRLRSDVERKRWHGLGMTQHSGSDINAGIYSASAHEGTYSRLHESAEMLLRAGWSVLVDATFLKRADRDAFGALARQYGAAFSILAPLATAAQLAERIVTRGAAANDASEATLEVLAEQMRVMEPLGQDELAQLWSPVPNTPS